MGKECAGEALREPIRDWTHVNASVNAGGGQRIGVDGGRIHRSCLVDPRFVRGQLAL